MPAARIKAAPAALRRWLVSEGYRLIAGTDEAGRGALAGPIVAAAVIMPANNKLKGVKDSKKLTPGQRDTWYLLIEQHALAVGLAEVSPSDIDRDGIQHANMTALEQAVAALTDRPDCVLADWYENPGFAVPWHGVVNGEESHPAIAAASIVAKVRRDRIMIELSEQYPEYGFAGHKGYGSAAHLQALRSHGPSPVHRLSFAPCRETA